VHRPTELSDGLAPADQGPLMGGGIPIYDPQFCGSKAGLPGALRASWFHEAVRCFAPSRNPLPFCETTRTPRHHLMSHQSVRHPAVYC
jgi:hypothetical protein